MNRVFDTLNYIFTRYDISKLSLSSDHCSILKRLGSSWGGPLFSGIIYEVSVSAAGEVGW